MCAAPNCPAPLGNLAPRLLHESIFPSVHAISLSPPTRSSAAPETSPNCLLRCHIMCCVPTTPGLHSWSRVLPSGFVLTFPLLWTCSATASLISLDDRLDFQSFLLLYPDSLRAASPKFADSASSSCFPSFVHVVQNIS